MDMMNSIASASMTMSEAQIQQQYAISVQKKAMETEELAAQELLEMLPQMPAKGQYIDVFA